MKLQADQNNSELIHNPDFVTWVFNPTKASDQFWKTYQTENPTRKKELEQARLLITSLARNEKILSEAEMLALWDKINDTKNSLTTKHNLIKRWSFAAGILLIMGISGWLMTRQGEKTTAYPVNYQAIATIIDPDNDIKLILSDKSQKTFSTREVDLRYNQEGKLETKTGKQVHTEDLTQLSEATPMNQLVVPRGKRSSIELADGTKLWLNSGSRAIYPVTFNGKTREIYIEGEGYLEVTHDKSKPFYVVTDLVKVKVLGTKFDISAYKDDDRVSVVLVEGSVQTSSPTEQLMIKPNQIMNFEKSTRKSTIEMINVLEYISWKDGWMLCNKEQIQSITTKLSRYYNVKINYSDAKLNNLTLTGKLDLKNNCEDVFKVICTTAPLKYEIKEDTIYLRPKE